MELNKNYCIKIRGVTDNAWSVVWMDHLPHPLSLNAELLWKDKRGVAVFYSAAHICVAAEEKKKE